MTCSTAARIARGYDEAPEYDASHLGPFVVSGDKIYVRADRVILPDAAANDKLWRDAAIATPKVTMEALYEVDRMARLARDGNATLDDLIGKAVYVATPYTKYAHGHAAAAYDAAEVTARLIDYGLSPLSPIAHSHAVATVGRLDKVDGELWQRVDAPWVRVAEACVVVKMPGWQESAGVQHEIAEFTAAGKPVVYLDWGMG